ncbi:Membrane insertase OXA1/ALB3/YidC [Cynara cardunculus var. scolymus]|uniref:Membrane insertase OXA1/ALB3/YidC n=1 Tax=Cynara cardunculus var. scolymus TaxID=59895 RepID=A0A124SCZ1_CYNCS|nr:Membrane insertase OXA1/ALB3/YidC [Cynara cardunculus var. scolymus]
MAYRRSLATKTRLFSQQRFAPSFSYVHHEDDRKNQYSDEKIWSALQSSRSFSCVGNTTKTSLGFGGGGGSGSFRDPRWSQFLHVPMTTSGFLLSRNMSTTIGDGSGAEKIEYMADVADILADKTMEVVSTQAPAVSEVAVAAADSWLPVAALQYAIDGIHNFTGMNWCFCQIVISEQDDQARWGILRPELEQIKQEMQDKGMSPSAVAEGQAKMKRVFSEHGVSTFTPLKGLFIQGPVFVSFFLAIQNMVEKVPSFKTGVIKRPNVKKLLNIPIIVPPPPSATSQSQPAFSFFEGLKKYAAAQAMKQHEPKPTTTSQSTTSTPLLSHNKPSSEENKYTNGKVSSSSVLSHRIKNLEKEVKGRKKNKRR